MKEKEILKEYLPERSINQVMKWIVQKNVHLKITKNRRSKLGDYRPPINYSNHRISINHYLSEMFSDKGHQKYKTHWFILMYF